MLTRGLMLMLLMGVTGYMPEVNNVIVAQKPAARYVCPMHPDVSSSKPGKCHKCKMALRLTRQKVEKPAPAETKSSDSSGVTSPRLPDVIVQDQNGKSLNFYTDLVKGKVVAVNFVFTTCTAICPALTATFRRVQQQLAEQKVAAQLISISVDPTVDTPERLQEFASKFKAEPGWTFVTGSTTDIDSILKEFGVGIANKNDHTPMVLIGNDAAGYWTRAYGLSSPTALVKLITEAANRK
jgi:cytochrome oxidase Cu insertion factor (SCO1/SenC/PrrC family)